jgi:hypothetical protein
MSDVDHEDEFDKAFEGFGEEPKQPDSPATGADDKDKQPTAPEAPKEGGEDNADKNQPTDKPDGEAKPGDPQPGTPGGDKPAGEPKDGAGDQKPAGDGKETPTAPEEPKPLTEEGVKSIISSIRAEERDAGKELQNTTTEVLDAYYPDGLSNVLVDQSTGKELRTPQDVIEASGGEMDVEQATQWLMNEQYKLDTEINKIKDDARKIAETTISFKRDSIAALQKYEPLFKWQPSLQQKAFNLLMKNIKDDKEKGVILSAPDVMDLYDTYLEPYQKAYEFSKGQPATNPNPPAPEPPKPGTDDRLDETGDGGASEVDDPNDFAQQVKKELAKGM